MTMDAQDIEWRCGCGHTNPDFDERCNECGESRYETEETLPAGTVGWCIPNCPQCDGDAS
jgi:hypothetical protein